MKEEVKLIECITTWQGEGPDSGNYMLLARFKKCQLSCSYCDTKVRMRNSVNGIFKFNDLQKAIDRIAGGLLITGGEPTLYNNDVANMLINLHYSIANVETNGYKLGELALQIPRDLNVKFIHSPKIDIKNQYDPIEDYILNDERIYIKLVIDKFDLAIDSLNQQFLLKLIIAGFPTHKIYLMPKGISFNELRGNSAVVFDIAEKYKCNISSRLHLIYNFI